MMFVPVLRAPKFSRAQKTEERCSWERVQGGIFISCSLFLYISLHEPNYFLMQNFQEQQRALDIPNAILSNVQKTFGQKKSSKELPMAVNGNFRTL